MTRAGRRGPDGPSGSATGRGPRLDDVLVGRGLARDAREARALLLAGRVLSGDTLLQAPASRVDPALPLRVRGLKTYASRAGAKLEAGLEGGAISVEGLRCLDLGASAGGFTDCLLRRGAREVLAVDVGRNQIDYRLRTDARVRVLEGTDYRSLALADLGAPLGFACADLSFTSVLPAFPRLKAWLDPGAPWVVLVKPQFECPPEFVGPGGVVRDAGARREALSRAEAAAAAAGMGALGSVESPLPGAKGNREWLLWGRA